VPADRDPARYHGEARALLGRRSWGADDVDYAIRLHDLLEVPGGKPDPVARQLRARLTGELQERLTRVDNPLYRLRLGYFSSSLLDTTDPLRRRLFLLLYTGFANFMGYESGARGQVDAAVEAFRELDQVLQAEGAQAREALGGMYHAAVLGLAQSCYLRYEGRRELLQADLRADLEREIRADLDRAFEASERALRISGNPLDRAAALAALGMGYAYRYEDDKRHGGRETIDTAVSRLQEAVRLAEASVRETGGAPAAVYALRGIRDRLAGALTVRNTLPDIDAAIAIYFRNRDEIGPFAMGKTVGETGSLATAYTRRWLLTKEPADRERARQAYEEAFAAGEARNLPAAFDIAAQWGGLTWQEGWWAEAGAAYQQATRIVHLAVRQQGSRADREWVVRKAPGVASRAAFGLARAGDLDDALATLETGRAVLLAEMFDRRALDYQSVARLTGDEIAREYQRLTDELTRLEAQLLLAGPAGTAATTAAIEEARKHRAVLRSLMTTAAKSALSALDGPPAMVELRQAAGPATVVYLAATSEGGLALILRPGGAPVEYAELEELTVTAALELVRGLDVALEQPLSGIDEEVCERLWLVGMSQLLPRLRDAAEVVFIPCGALAALPWHAAKLPGRSAGHVLDHLAVSYMPNIRSLPAARAAWQSMPAAPRVLAVEAPEPTSGPRLRTTQEIAAVQASHGADFRVIWLPGAEATKPRLREALSQFEVLHFAGHAYTDADPLASGLVLARDELLTIRELLANGVGAARFAVLSACSTARIEDLVSDEMLSFPTALMQCSLGGVVGSLWPAADRPTVHLMQAFYQEWRGGRASPREALRAAQQRMRERYRSPLTWANFVYVGP